MTEMERDAAIVAGVLMRHVPPIVLGTDRVNALARDILEAIGGAPYGCDEKVEGGWTCVANDSRRRLCHELRDLADAVDGVTTYAGSSGRKRIAEKLRALAIY